MWDALTRILPFTRRAPTVEYTYDDIKTCIHRGVMLIITDDKVYDVTNFIAQHPGGAESLLSRVDGHSDCTRDKSFHSIDARSEWDKLCVGKLCRSGRRQPTAHAPIIPPGSNVAEILERSTQRNDSCSCDIHSRSPELACTPLSTVSTKNRQLPGATLSLPSSTTSQQQHMQNRGQMSFSRTPENTSLCSSSNDPTFLDTPSRQPNRSQVGSGPIINIQTKVTRKKSFGSRLRL